MGSGERGGGGEGGGGGGQRGLEEEVSERESRRLHRGLPLLAEAKPERRSCQELIMQTLSCFVFWFLY